MQNRLVDVFTVTRSADAEFRLVVLLLFALLNELDEIFNYTASFRPFLEQNSYIRLSTN